MVGRGFQFRDGLQRHFYLNISPVLLLIVCRPIVFSGVTKHPWRGRSTIGVWAQLFDSYA